ncbi:MAG: ribosome recycling factor [Gemmatimonadota bacterium]
MSGSVLEQADEKMDGAVKAVRREFNTVRTGKATPALLDTVKVDAYGSTVPLDQISNVTAPEPNLLLVQPYDENIADDIKRSIEQADMGLNPSVDRGMVRVPVPPLSEERRKEMVKVLHRMAEEGRIAVRQIRQDAKNRLQEMERDGEISEDQYHRWLDDLQELTDDHVETIDALLDRKEDEVMEV